MTRMRNTISVLGMFCIAVASSAPPAEHPFCDYQTCVGILLIKDVTCSSVSEAVTCAKATVLSNPECSRYVKDTIRRYIQQGDGYLLQNCQAGPVPVPLPRTGEATLCDFQQCLDILKKYGVNCRTVAAAIECAETTILNNPDCPPAVKDVAREKVKQGEEYLKEHCHGQTSVRRSLPGCEFEKCLEGLKENGITCSSVTEAILCGKTIILNNPDCPKTVKDVAREKIQEGEDYLKQRCHGQEFVERSLPGCEFERCLDGLKENGVTCSTVPEAILCAQTTILNNPDCPKTVKDVAREKIQDGEEYLKNECHDQLFAYP